MEHAIATGRGQHAVNRHGKPFAIVMRCLYRTGRIAVKSRKNPIDFRLRVIDGAGTEKRQNTRRIMTDRIGRVNPIQVRTIS